MCSQDREVYRRSCCAYTATQRNMFGSFSYNPSGNVLFHALWYLFLFFFFVLCIISSILHSSDNTVLFVAYGLILLLLWLLMKNIRWKTWEMRISNENIHKTLYMLYKWWYTLYMNIVSKCLNNKKNNNNNIIIIINRFDLWYANYRMSGFHWYSVNENSFNPQWSLSACTSWLYSELLSSCYWVASV